MSATRQYTAADIDYGSWYSDWMKQLARDYTRREIESRLGIAAANARSASKSHLRAIEATSSMQSQSQRRAQTGNVTAACGEEKIALSGALEIYDLFPQFTKEWKNCACDPQIMPQLLERSQMSKHMCQEGSCKNKAKSRSPTGLLVCGVHRRSIDAYYERLKRPERCEPLSK